MSITTKQIIMMNSLFPRRKVLSITLLKYTTFCDVAYLDKNGDGTISPQELSDALAECDIKISQDSLLQLMAHDLPKRSSKGPQLTSEAFVVRASLLHTSTENHPESMIEGLAAISCQKFWRGL